MMEPLSQTAFVAFTATGILLSIFVFAGVIHPDTDKRIRLILIPGLFLWLILPWVAYLLFNVPWTGLFRWVPLAPHEPDRVITRFDPAWNGPER